MANTHIIDLTGLNTKQQGDTWTAAENNLVVGAVIEAQNNLDDLVGDHIDDAPSDGKQYARKNAAWSETVEPMEVEVVTSGTTSKTAEVGKYYLFSGEVGTLAITLPSILTTTFIKGPVFSITTGASPSISITATAAIRWYKGWEGFAANTTYEINAIYDGVKWVLAHAIVEPTNS